MDGRLQEAVKLAIHGAGGVRRLAARVGRHPGRVCRWRKVPQALVFEVARASGVDAEVLRPDLKDWIVMRRRQQVLARGRERFGILAAVAVNGGELLGEAELVDFLVILSAARFVAAARGLELGHVVHGQDRPHAEARSLAMALASIVGRAKHGQIAALYGCTRQNVDNVTMRYLRRRDGDDPEDQVLVDEDGETTVIAGGGRVIERGRLRLARAEGDGGLWKLQDRFAAVLEGRGK